MNKPKFYAGVKKLVKGTVIVIALTATLTLSGCMTAEQKEISKGSIAINDETYRIGDIYFLTSKENPDIYYFCDRELIGSSSYMSGDIMVTDNAYCYTDVKTGEIIAVSLTGFSFNKAGKTRFPTKEEQNKIKKIGKKHVNITELYKTVDYGIFNEKDMNINEEDIVVRISQKSK